MKTRIFLQILLVALFPYVAQGQLISTIAGTGTPGYSGDGGLATAAMINNPLRTYVDSAGNVYVADHSFRIRKITPSGIITTFAGIGTLTYSGDGGPATAAGIEYARGMGMDRLGNFYFSEVTTTIAGRSYIRKIDTAGIITTIGGNGLSGFGGDGGPATNAVFFSALDIALDKTGNIFIADNGNNRIRKIDTMGIITTVAGVGTYAFSGDGGLATAAEVRAPGSVAVDDSNCLYLTDNNSRIRKVNSAGIINTIAGDGYNGFLGDGGPATAARFNVINKICVDNDRNIFVADVFNHRVRKVDTAGIINTVAGVGTDGHSGDCGPATAAEIGNSTGVSVDRIGSIYVADASNHWLRKIYAAGITSILGPDSICTNSTALMLDSVVSGVWSSGSPSVAVIGSNTGVVTGVSAGSAIITYAFTGCYVIDSITVKPVPFAGSISGVDSVCPGDTITLHDTVSGGIWGLTNSSVAGISSSGVVTGIIPGVDTVTYTVTLNGCTSVATFPFVILPYTACPNGVNEVVAVGPIVKIYPNPVADELIIQSSKGYSLFIISNALGQEFISQPITSAQTIVDVKMLSAGLYYATFTGNNGIVIRKFVKQ